MKRIFLFVILLLAGYQMPLFSQSCLPEGITFTTQAQIDSFQINYPGCTMIEGDVDIMGINISNLNGLIVLTSIGGSLRIGHSIPPSRALVNLTGLDNLTFIGGNLSFWSNDSLTTLTGLENLETIGGDFYLGYSMYGNYYNTPNLLSLNALTSLHQIGGSVYIWKCESLTDLTGLEQISHI